MNVNLALASVACRKTIGHDEDHQTVVLEPSYGQLNYYSPVLLALARETRRPFLQRLALWDQTLGAIQKTRYVTPNGEWLLFQLGGYAYAWCDPTVPDRVEKGAPLSFLFPSVNEAYLRDSYEPDGIVVGVRQGQAVVHAGGRPVFVDLRQAQGALRIEDDGAKAAIHYTPSSDSGLGGEVIELVRPGHLTLTRKCDTPVKWWCCGPVTRTGNMLTWPDGTRVTATKGALSSVAPEGYADEKIVGMGKLKCVDPMPMKYPLVTAMPEGGALVIEVRTGR
jgi:hypothetical protein